MTDIGQAEKRARRLLELAALLACVAILILVIDVIIKQQIARAAMEASRAIDVEKRSRAGEFGPDGPDRVGNVGDALPLDQGEDQDQDVPASVD
jgi:hypothetical protein